MEDGGGSQRECGSGSLEKAASETGKEEAGGVEGGGKGAEWKVYSHRQAVITGADCSA